MVDINHSNENFIKIFKYRLKARVAELVYAHDLGSCSSGIGSSSLLLGKFLKHL